MGFWKKTDESDESQNIQEGSTPSAAIKESSKLPKYKAPESVRSALGKGTVIQGKLSFDTPVQIDGKLKGEVFSTDTLIVGPTGEVDADVDVQTLVVHGRVQGTVRVKEHTVLAASAIVSANIVSGSLSIEEGAVFNGNCSMKPSTEKSSSLKTTTTAKDQTASSASTDGIQQGASSSVTKHAASSNSPVKDTTQMKGSTAQR